MTRYDDADRVLAVGKAHRASPAGRSDAFGELTVGLGLAIGDLAQRRPHPLLEVGPLWRQGQVERCERACEVGVQLVGGRSERFVLPATWVDLADLTVLRAVPLQVHIETDDRAIFGDQGQWTDGTVDHGVTTHQAASSSGILLMGCSPVAQRYCTAYERHGRHRREWSDSALAVPGIPSLSAASLTPRSPARNASGSPRDRIAMLSTVQGPKPCRAFSLTLASRQSAPRSRSSRPCDTASTRPISVRRRDCGMARSAGSIAASTSAVGNR